MAVYIFAAVVAVALGLPIWLGLNTPTARTNPNRCGVTPPGRLIDGGRIMDPTRIDRAVE